MGIFGKKRRGTDTSFPKSDRGLGHFDDYAFDLRPRNKGITMVLAGSDPHQDELRTIAESLAAEESGEAKVEGACGWAPCRGGGPTTRSAKHGSRCASSTSRARTGSSC
jgi:hypothetical protein